MMKADAVCSCGFDDVCNHYGGRNSNPTGAAVTVVFVDGSDQIASVSLRMERRHAKIDHHHSAVSGDRECRAS